MDRIDDTTTLGAIYTKLNEGDIEAVAMQIRGWHPSILGNMRAVARAKQIRYPRFHPDYARALEIIQTENPHASRS